MITVVTQSIEVSFSGHRAKREVDEEKIEGQMKNSQDLTSREEEDAWDHIEAGRKKPTEALNLAANKSQAVAWLNGSSILKFPLGGGSDFIKQMQQSRESSCNRWDLSLVFNSPTVMKATGNKANLTCPTPWADRNDAGAH